MDTALTPTAWLDLFGRIADDVGAAVAAIDPGALRDRTDRSGQYALDLVADDVVLDHLRPTGAAVLDEEAGVLDGTGIHADLTVIVDPVDGSTNRSRDVPHSACSLALLDGGEITVALVADLATGERFSAVLGEGARLDGRPIVPTDATTVEGSMVGVSGWPGDLGWRQFRALGAGALDLCYVACGRFDAFVDANRAHGVWDYAGAMLVVSESGALIEDIDRAPLLTLDHTARRGPLAAATPELLADLHRVLGAAGSG